ncbi:MAG: RNA methyltransferase [Alphaproteobacteria bacterium]|jgi:tRNA/rRNA methyltransferase|nr:RNA methyltransferase [Alphaproteobacteria bacterium]
MAGTNSTARLLQGGPVIVLVRPQLGENIGAAARAMLNFGLSEMRLVSPRDGWPNEAARAMASRADRVLDDAQVFDSTDSAIVDLRLLLATTARPRDMEKPVLTPREAAAELRAAEARGEAAGVLFGAERSGLDNEDVSRAQAVVEVPANPGFASLNLAQAVLLIGYEWFQLGNAAVSGAGAEESPPATLEGFNYFFGRLEQALDEKGFLKPPEKRPSMLRNIRNMLTRARFTEQDLRTLHGILSALKRGGDES